jgi:hypothetical protein
LISLVSSVFPPLPSAPSADPLSLQSRPHRSPTCQRRLLRPPRRRRSLATHGRRRVFWRRHVLPLDTSFVEEPHGSGREMGGRHYQGQAGSLWTAEGEGAGFPEGNGGEVVGLGSEATETKQYFSSLSARTQIFSFGENAERGRKHSPFSHATVSFDAISLGRRLCFRTNCWQGCFSR